MTLPLPRPSNRLFFLLLAAFAAVPAAAQEPLTGIHVSGFGEIQAVPDVADVTLEVRREGLEPAALKTELDQVVARVLELADELDIPRRHVTAAAVNVFPRYPRPEEKEPVEGVIATRSIEVHVEDLARLAELINGSLERGVNGVGGVRLDVANRAELERQALDLAIDDAVREARQVAERFGVRLGPLKNASSSGHHQPMMMEAMARGSAAKDSFSPGLITLRRDVQATFGIRSGRGD